MQINLNTESLKIVIEVVSALADILTIFASGIAISIFFLKRAELSIALSLLLNWSYQTTLSDINGKLDRLNEYNANEALDHPEIKNIFHEIAGQIRGNPRLLTAAPALPDRIESLSSGKKLSEPNKRSMVAEIREVIRNLQVKNLNQDFRD